MSGTELYHHGILGMKWGVRRYQNKDGSLTAAGKERYDRDQRENAAKKKDNRIDVSKPDPKRWEREDLERSKKVIDSGTASIRQLNNVLEKGTRKNKKAVDLSSLTEKEMRDKINRELLEQQYTKLVLETSEEDVSKGKRYLSVALDAAGEILAATGSALSILLAIKELKG